MFEIVKLARNRSRSRDHYRAMQEYIASRAINELEKRGVGLAGGKVLELAAGFGGYSTVLNRKAKCFLANDLSHDRFFEENDIPFLQFDVMKEFPLETASFDFVFCSSLIEHLPNPAPFLRECGRVLRPEGTLCLSFPPFYSLAMIGGHGFQPFHFFGERMALRMHNRKNNDKIESYATVWGNWGLYPLTIGKVAELITQSGFQIFDTYSRMSPINTAKLPWILKDLATWHVCYLARNPART